MMILPLLNCYSNWDSRTYRYVTQSWKLFTAAQVWVAKIQKRILIFWFHCQNTQKYDTKHNINGYRFSLHFPKKFHHFHVTLTLPLHADPDQLGSWHAFQLVAWRKHVRNLYNYYAKPSTVRLKPRAHNGMGHIFTKCHEPTSYEWTNSIKLLQSRFAYITDINIDAKQ
jgi:hypothetical protein